MNELTKGPWKWQTFGRLMLVDAHGRRPIILCANPDRGGRTAHLETRGENGSLVELTADHPDARLIEAAPDLLAACIEIDAFLATTDQREWHEDNGTLDQYTPDPMWLRVRAAIAKAKGEMQP